MSTILDRSLSRILVVEERLSANIAFISTESYTYRTRVLVERLSIYGRLDRRDYAYDLRTLRVLLLLAPYRLHLTDKTLEHPIEPSAAIQILRDSVLNVYRQTTDDKSLRSSERQRPTTPVIYIRARHLLPQSRFDSA